VLLPNINNPVYTHLAAKIIEYAQKKNHTVFLNYSELNKEREKKILRSFADISADGFIIALTFNENKKELLSLAAQKPVIMRGFIDEDMPLDCVYVDFEKGSFDAATYLINSGHKKIFFAGALSCLNAKGERISGFENAMAKAGIKYSEENFIDAGTSIESAYKNSLGVLRKNQPTALIVQSDYLAFGVMRAISELKLRIPEDISIISFDNIEFSNYGMVPLTTMTQSVDEQAKILIDKLLSKISDQDSFPERIKLDTKMIVRNSVCKRKDA
jgi:DNA-binding LacI/PurR family transcriptional regulator